MAKVTGKKIYKNYTKITQVVYENGTNKVEVLPEGTLEASGNWMDKYAHAFKEVTPEELAVNPLTDPTGGSKSGKDDDKDKE